MITELLLGSIMDLFFLLFDGILANIHIPGLSDELMSNLYTYIDYFDYAGQFIGFFLPMSVFKSCLTAVIVLFSAKHLYPVIIWIIHKIPLSID